MKVSMLSFSSCQHFYVIDQTKSFENSVKTVNAEASKLRHVIVFEMKLPLILGREFKKLAYINVPFLTTFCKLHFYFFSAFPITKYIMHCRSFHVRKSAPKGAWKHEIHIIRKPPTIWRSRIRKSCQIEFWPLFET